MRELEKEFIGKGEVKGFLFSQVFFDNNYYIYSVDPGVGKITHYEVFKRREIKALPPFAPEDYVQYPKANFFGINAWVTKTLERAHEIVKEKSSLNRKDDNDISN